MTGLHVVLPATYRNILGVYGLSVLRTLLCLLWPGEGNPCVSLIMGKALATYSFDE